MIRVQLPPHLVEDARAYADGSREPAEPRNAATVVLLQGRVGGARGLPAAASDLDGVRRRHVRLPRRRRGPARLRPTTLPGDRLGRALAGGVGLAARHRRGDRAGPGVCRRAGDLRGVRRAARGGVRRHRGRRHDRRGLGDRPGCARGARAVVHRLPRPAGAGAAHRPARRLGGLADACLRAASLPDLVLRRAPARGTAHPRRLHRVRPGDLAAGHAGRLRRRAGADLHAAADVPDLPRGGPVRRTGGRARRGPRAKRRDVHAGRSRRTTRAGRSRCRPASRRSSSPAHEPRHPSARSAPLRTGLR